MISHVSKGCKHYQENRHQTTRNPENRLKATRNTVSSPNEQRPPWSIRHCPRHAYPGLWSYRLTYIKVLFTSILFWINVHVLILMQTYLGHVFVYAFHNEEVAAIVGVFVSSSSS